MKTRKLNPEIEIKVGRKVIGITRDSMTVEDAKRKFLRQYSGYDPQQVKTQIKRR